jgi:hypothetical protein
MHIQTYRRNRSRHFDLIGGGGVRLWSIDLVSATAWSLLVIGFGCALAAPWAG